MQKYKTNNLDRQKDTNRKTNFAEQADKLCPRAVNQNEELGRVANMADKPMHYNASFILKSTPHFGHEL